MYYNYLVLCMSIGLVVACRLACLVYINFVIRCISIGLFNEFQITSLLDFD